MFDRQRFVRGGFHSDPGLGGLRAPQLITLADAILQQVRVTLGSFFEQRDRIFGIIVLGKNHHAGAWVALANLLRSLDCSLVNVGGMRMSVTKTWGSNSSVAAISWS